MVIEIFKIEVDVQITILKFRNKFDIFLFLLYDLNDHLLLNLDHIISITSMMHVAWSNNHKLYHMDEEVLKIFLKFKS